MTLVIAQLALFAAAALGHPLELFPALSTPLEVLYRVDALGVAFGVTQILCLGVIASFYPRGPRNAVPAFLLISVAMLQVAYSRNILALFIGIQVLGIALWFALRYGWIGSRRRWLLVPLLAPSWVLWLVGFANRVPDFSPPVSGDPVKWGFVSLFAISLVCIAVGGLWPLHTWDRLASASTRIEGAALLGLYVMFAPYPLLLALVSGNWQPWGGWLLALAGTIGLVGAAAHSWGANVSGISLPIASAHVAAALIGIGLAPQSYLAGAGAVAVILSGMLWVTGTVCSSYSLRRFLPLGSIPGAWLLTVGASQLGYTLISVLILPAFALVSLAALRRVSQPYDALTTGRRRTDKAAGLLISVPLVFASVFPQVLFDGLLRPILGAVPVGVAPPGDLRGVPLIGLAVGSPEVLPSATLPSTGIVIMLVTALIAARWIGRAASHFAPAVSLTIPSPLLNETLDDLLPGSATAARALDPGIWLARLRRLF